MARFVLAAAILLAAPLAVRAASLRAWVDKDGVYHVDDTPQVQPRKPPRKLQSPAETPRQPQAKAQH